MFTVSVGGQQNIPTALGKTKQTSSRAFNDLHAVSRDGYHTTSAVVVRPIQGERRDGSDARVLQGLARACGSQRGHCWCLMEVQCGMGRTGDLLLICTAVTPDISDLCRKR